MKEQLPYIKPLHLTIMGKEYVVSFKPLTIEGQIVITPEVSSAMQPPNTDTQDKLKDLITDPNNIAKAVEGSMDKRNAVMTDTLDEQINSIFVEFLGYLPFSEDSSIEVEAKHDAIKALKALFTEHSKEVDRLARIDQATYIAEQLTDDQLTKELISNCCGASDIYEGNLGNNEGVCADCYDLIQKITAIMQPSLNKEVQSVLNGLCKIVANQDKVIDALEERVSKLELKLKEANQ